MVQKQKISGFDLVKTIGYVLVIILIFSPLTFLISNTITGNAENDCYSRSPEQVFEPIKNTTHYDNSAMIECESNYKQLRERLEQQQFLIVSIISLVTISLLLYFGTKIDSVISYSLFFSSALNTIIIVIKNSSSSMMAAGLGIILFILVLIFINKNLKK